MILADFFATWIRIRLKKRIRIREAKMNETLLKVMTYNIVQIFKDN